MRTPLLFLRKGLGIVGWAPLSSWVVSSEYEVLYQVARGLVNKKSILRMIFMLSTMEAKYLVVVEIVISY